MNAPVFPTKWDFLAATVLFGVHPDTQALLLGSENGTDAVWVCWTDQELAEHQLATGYVLRQGAVRQVLPALPPGTGVRIDPGLPQGMAFDGTFLAELVPLCVPFPAGTSVDLGELAPLPGPVRSAFDDVARNHAFVERVWLLRFRVEDGPTQGLVVYDAGVGAEAHESAVHAIGRALESSVRGTDLDAQLAGIQVMALSDLPDGPRAWVEEQRPLVTPA